MKDEIKTKQQLIKEMSQLRQKNAELELAAAKQKQKVVALKESEATNRALLEAIPDAIFRMNKHGTYLSFVPAKGFKPIVPPEVFLGKNQAEIMPTEIAQQFRYYLEQALHTGEVQVYEYPITIEAETQYFEARLVALHEDDILGIVRDITKRKQTENSLRESEEQFKAQYNGFPHPVYTLEYIDDDFVVSNANTAAIEMTEGKITSFYGKRASDLWRDDLDLIDDIERCYFKQTTIKREKLYTFKSTGETQYLSIVAAHVPPKYVLIYTENISEHKWAEEALRESEKRFRDISFSMADWIWEVDQDGVYSYCSEKVEEILGYSPEELLGKTPFDLMPEQEAERVSEIFKEVVSKRKQIVDLENWNLTKDGEDICLLTNGTPIFDNEGVFLGYRGVDKDITDRKKTEDTLRESEAKYAAVVETASDGIVITLDSIIQFANSGMEQITGYKVSELKGMNITNLLAPEMSEVVIQRAHQRLAGEQPPPIYEACAIRKNGDTTEIEISATVVQYEDKLANNGNCARYFSAQTGRRSASGVL
ncbi:MAG: PAS domain S-box protein [Chloroflexi bacterium]|jgi:PAS domain S-box-containing protein|nr:PAS domain S-box protein [Chloroflexota bacterium]